MISSCKYFDLRTKTEKNNSEPRQEKEMIDFYLDEDYELVYTSFGTGTK